ncbi:MAG: DUF2461 domain-containing protein [Eubacteriales bacterium]|nr:DUF2461 domain-containing protein [Eubacteriales bacterium]MDD3880855.1 DUF2461 domain-containing protein [Eubacteriales bacterium]MDD4511778.1 DUF2461 domain-containing protein [Eubacteriales bacterium]
MFSGFTDKTFEFLMGLSFNNSPEYFHSHHDEYDEYWRKPYFQLIDALSPTLSEIDNGIEIRPEKALAHIRRDTRFTKDKTPYRTHLWAAFRAGNMDKDGSIFFWVEFGLGEHNCWGLGTWNENKPLMEQMRRSIIAAPYEALDLTASLEKAGFQYSGWNYKRMKYPPELKDELKPLYSSRSPGWIRNLSDRSMLFKPEIVDAVIADFKLLAPAYHYLRGAYDAVPPAEE